MSKDSCENTAFLNKMCREMLFMYFTCFRTDG